MSAAPSIVSTSVTSGWWTFAISPSLPWVFRTRPFFGRRARGRIPTAIANAILRIVGKRELGQANTLDLVVLLLVANAVQNGIIGNDISVTGAVIGAVTLFAINELVSRTTYAFPWAARALEGRFKVQRKTEFRGETTLAIDRSVSMKGTPLTMANVVTDPSIPP